MPEYFKYDNFNNIEDGWIKYEGDFVNDTKNGIGTLYLANNDTFFGEFKDDAIHGKGSYTFFNGKNITGEW